MHFTYSTNIDELGWADNQRCQQIVNDIVSRFDKQSRPCTFVGCALWEIMNANSNIEVLLETLTQHNIRSVLFFTEAQQNDEWVDSIIDKCDDVVFFDFFLYMTFKEILVKNKDNCNGEWNPLADKFLFLTGAPRKERLRTFYKLYQADLVPKMLWSLFVPNDKTLIDPEWLPELPASKVYDFFKRYDGNPDKAEVISHPDGTKVIGNSLRYDKQLWQQSRFRLITETSIVDTWRPFHRFTEKTWVTIANKMPFLLLGKPKMLKVLQSKGFKTFEEHTQVTDYDTIKDVDNRIDALVKNAQAWINDGMPVNLVQQDIEHNYQHFITLGQNIEQQLVDFIQKHKLTIELDDLVPTVHNLYP